VNLDVAAKQPQFSRQWFLALFVALVLAAELVYGLYKGRQAFALAQPAPVSQAVDNTQAIATGLYLNYMLPVEIASLLLLVAIVGAVVMAKRKFE